MEAKIGQNTLCFMSIDASFIFTIILIEAGFYFKDLEGLGGDL